MLRTDKNKIIDMIRELRTKIGKFSKSSNEDEVENAQKYLNSIQDKVFSL